MKTYLSENMFSDPDFPLAVTCLLQRPSMVPHCHDFIELVLVAKGHTIHHVESDSGESISYGLIQGDCFSILPGEVHAYTESHNLLLYNVAFQEQLLEKELDELKSIPVWHALFESCHTPLRNWLHLLPHKRRIVEDYLKKMIIEISRRRPGYRFRSRLAFLECLVTIGDARELGWHSNGTVPVSGILKTLDYMENALERPFDLNKLAQMANMSVSSYTKKFRDVVGDSPGEYFLGLKLEKVRCELIETDYSLAELAYRNGFCDDTYLVKQFRKRHGITPARYRRLLAAK
jgi:AraC-like DNA-binding protein/quercetin dioxygenase-like cupin family protein